MSVMDYFLQVTALYRLFGMHWFTRKGDCFERTETAFYIALNFCLVTWLFHWIYNHQQLVIYTDNVQGYLVDFSKFLLMIFTYYSLMLECGIRQGVLREIWVELNHLRHNIVRAEWSSQQRRHLVVLVLFLAYLTWWELTFAYWIAGTTRGKNFTISFWVLFTLLHLCQFHILLYTDLLGYCLEQLNADLSWTIELSKGASRYGGPRSDGHICERLSATMHGFARAERILGLINCAFGYSFAIIKFINHVYILTDTYWIVNGFINGKIFASIYLECCLSSKFICLMLNLHSNERIVQECRRMRELLHRVDLGWQLRCDKGLQMVQHFLLTLESSQPIGVTAMSIFKMDYGIMMQITLNVTASISFFIQASG